MIPPLVRRCPECGHTDWGSRFRVVDGVESRSAVACPSCAHRFETVDGPLLE